MPRTELFMKHTITFLPDNITATVDKGENLLNAAARAGVYIHAYCGGDGICGKCKVLINKGEVRSAVCTALRTSFGQPSTAVRTTPSRRSMSCGRSTPR